MASLATHLSAFLFLFPTGIRRLLSSSSLYLKNPSLFKSKPWYFSDPKSKNLDLFSLLIALPIASFSEFFLFLTFSSHPTFRFSFFHQSALLFLFWVLLILLVFREYLDPFLFHESFLFLFAATAFFIDYFFIANDGFTGVGVGAAVYDLLAKLTLLCGVCCVYLSVRPSAFFAEFLLSSGIVFKGTWVLQAGLSLYTDAFALKGCQKMGLEKVGVKCDLEEDGLRGVALMNLLFIGHAIGVLVAGFAVFGLLSWNRNWRFGEAGGPLLAELESESMLMRPLPAEFEIE